MGSMGLTGKYLKYDAVDPNGQELLSSQSRSSSEMKGDLFVRLDFVRLAGFVRLACLDHRSVGQEIWGERAKRGWTGCVRSVRLR